MTYKILVSELPDKLQVSIVDENGNPPPANMPVEFIGDVFQAPNLNYTNRVHKIGMQSDGSWPGNPKGPGVYFIPAAADHGQALVIVDNAGKIAAIFPDGEGSEAGVYFPGGISESEPEGGIDWIKSALGIVS